MRFLRHAMAALLIGALAPSLVAPALAQTCVCPPEEGISSGPIIQADEPPPPLPEYDQPPMPEPGYYWTPGYWAWNNYDYYWVPGVWVEPPQPDLLWTPGYWAFVGGVYLFHRGYWAPHVGFYGGVNYGFGYNGMGYEGGRWDNRRFYYNTTVNNFGDARVTNVYTQPVAPPVAATRVSFNGGPGGIVVKPTPEQERLSTEPRVRPTPLQVNQARTASMTPDQFISTNKGKPPIAATPRPGDFRGKGVVPAKAAGSAQAVPAQTPSQPALEPNKEKLPGEVKPAPPPAIQENRVPGQPTGTVRPEEKLPATAPGQPPLPPGARPLGVQPNAPGQLPKGAVRPQEKLPAAAAPGLRPEPKLPLEQKSPAAGAPGQRLAPPKPEPGAPGGQKREQEMQRQQLLQRQQEQDRVRAQQEQEKAGALQRQQLKLQQEQQRARAAQQDQERARAAQQAQQRALQQQQVRQREMQRAAAPQRQPPQPGGKPERECGKPGLPPCPR
jgi:hypothetical protein